MSQSGNEQPTISEYCAVCVEEYNYDTDKFDKKLTTMSGYMRDAYELSKNKHQLYKVKQQLIKRKFEIADKLVYLNKNITSLRKSKLNNYKFGKVTNDTGAAIKPANDFERKLYLEADLSGFEEAKQVMDNHMGFIEDSMKNISDMIYGIQYVIVLEDFKKMLK
jgi:hypothetical protein